MTNDELFQRFLEAETPAKRLYYKQRIDADEEAVEAHNKRVQLAEARKKGGYPARNRHERRKAVKLARAKSPPSGRERFAEAILGQA